MALVPLQNLSIQDHANVHLGDVYHVNQTNEQNEIRPLGLCWGSAPLIDADNFIGRSGELDQMAQILQPGERLCEQRRLVVGGIGGIGKTQSAISYVRRYRQYYTSIFWLNATTELTLKASYRSIAQSIINVELLESITDEQIILRVQKWLSHTKNSDWLLLFDNHDDPDHFEIDKYCPNVGHGSLIITSRLPERLQGDKLRLLPLQDINECLDILRTRSQRKIDSEDTAARSLINRLCGLPLALATAGAYLLRGSVPISKYLYAYERGWKVDPRRPPRLRDYENRTLYTTWDLTYSQLGVDDPEAAQLLKLFGYFSNQDISYDLLQAGRKDDRPLWLNQLVADEFTFESAVSTLIEYCLVERKGDCQTYSIHKCVHDWIFNGLNEIVDWRLYRYAFQCTSASIDRRGCNDLDQAHYNGLASHAKQLTHERFQQYDLFDVTNFEDTDPVISMACLLSHQMLWTSATWLYEQILAHYEKIRGAERLSTLAVLVNLASLYHGQGRLNEASILYEKATLGFEELSRSEHPSALTTLDNLGTLHAQRGQLGQAEELFEKSLVGRENVMGPCHIDTVTSIINLGHCYIDQGKLDHAEIMFDRALERQKMDGFHETSTKFFTFHSLGRLYSKQGRISDAENMYKQAVKGYGKLLGPNHQSTLEVVKNLSSLYLYSDKLADAEQSLLRVLAEREKLRDLGSLSTINVMCQLGSLYARRNEPYEAEKMYLRALDGSGRIEHPDSIATLDIFRNLGLVYIVQGKLNQAEDTISRTLRGCKISSQLIAKSAVALLNRLGRKQLEQGNLAEAEISFTRVLSYDTENDGFSPWMGTIGDLAYVMALSVIRAKDTQCAAYLLGRFIRQLDTWLREAKIDRMIYLVRPLVCVNDDVNAAFAILDYMKAVGSSPLDFWRVPCNGCCGNITLQAGRHICRQCEYVDICNVCMAAYRDKMFTIPNCDGHDFFNAGSAILKLLDAANVDEIPTRERLMKQLRQQYPVSEQDGSHLQPSAPNNLPPACLGPS